jgi:glycine/D-amino acid oxidase-like deaminating enzyme/nitrite reductase/ring-hydroxylating ferredoxin subunit
VVIVGGGLTGITAAYLCQKSGLTFALIERDRLARVDTGHTTAHLTSVTDLRLFEIAETFGQEQARTVWDAGGAAIDQIVNNIRTENISCDFKWLPGYLHAPDARPNARTVDELLKEAGQARELHIPAEFVSATPFFGGAGVRFPDQAIFHPRKYLAGLITSFGGKGAHVFEQTAVDGVQDSPLAVKAGAFTVQCRHVILATHNPLQGKTGTLAAMLFQTKLALYTSYALSAKLPAQGAEGTFWDTNDPYYYLRIEHRRGHDRAIFGGEDHKTGQEKNTEDAFRRLEKRFRKLFPNAIIDRRWSGQVIETNDGLPFIGSISVNQFIATGFSGNGMTFGTLGAMMAVDAIVGRKNRWTELFNVHRKKIAGGTWQYVKENKDYPYHMVRDRLSAADGNSLDSLQRGQGKILNLDGKKVAAYRDIQGEVTLCSPVCPHLKCIVDWNEAEHTWDCPCHGSRFTATGDVMSGPAQDNLEKISAGAAVLAKS